MPETLLVRAGLFGGRQVKAALEDVAEVIPRYTWIALSSRPPRTKPRPHGRLMLGRG